MRNKKTHTHSHIHTLEICENCKWIFGRVGVYKYANFSAEQQRAPHATTYIRRIKVRTQRRRRRDAMPIQHAGHIFQTGLIFERARACGSRFAVNLISLTRALKWTLSEWRCRIIRNTRFGKKKRSVRLCVAFIYPQVFYAQFRYAERPRGVEFSSYRTIYVKTTFRATFRMFFVPALCIINAKLNGPK